MNRPAFARIASMKSGEIAVKYKVLSPGNCRIHAHQARPQARPLNACMKT
ncbi:MAG: hypothetical protein M3347_01520 [Armatimonadota bacterium]|nr:hypothetical protein [Armatimonadota bacterium]